MRLVYPVPINTNNDDDIKFSWRNKVLCADQTPDWYYEE
jgi:hypothetical protein